MTSCKTMTKNFPIGTFWLDGLHILIHPCFRRLFSSGQNLSLPVFKEYSWSIKVRKNFHFGHRKCNYWKWGKETCVTFGGRFVNDTNTNQHWVWSCTSFLYQVNFACFYQHTSCYILVPLLLVSSPFLLIRWFFITRLFLVPLLFVFFSPFLLTMWFFITRWGGSRPRAGAASVRGERERCVPVPEFPCLRVPCVSLCLCARPTWTWGTPPQWELLGPIGQAAR